MKVHLGFVSEVWTLWKESCFLVPVCVGCDLFFKYDGYQNFDSEYEINMNDD
jgi:hypothetical protein